MSHIQVGDFCVYRTNAEWPYTIIDGRKVDLPDVITFGEWMHFDSPFGNDPIIHKGLRFTKRDILEDNYSFLFWDGITYENGKLYHHINVHGYTVMNEMEVKL